MPTYEFANKKTEKLVTALYMITDCMETDDAIKNKLRFLGVELLSDMHKLPLFSPVEKHASVALTLSRISEIVALVEIAHMIGFVSEMNATILKKEFNLLISELHSYQSEIQKASIPTQPGFGGSLFENQKNASFTLSEKMFEVEGGFPSIAETATKQTSVINSIKDNTIPKRTPYMSFRTDNVLSPIPALKRLQNPESSMTRSERTQKILALIKDLPAQAGKKDGEPGLSIKDISVSFSDCSEKTIQRELNSLISKGQIKKLGAKRWSRYTV
jgi:hypothetical protein